MQTVAPWERLKAKTNNPERFALARRAVVVIEVGLQFSGRNDQRAAHSAAIDPPRIKEGQLLARGIVTDHRIGFSTHNLNKILDGGLDEILEALKNASTQKALEEAE